MGNKMKRVLFIHKLIEAAAEVSSWVPDEPIENWYGDGRIIKAQSCAEKAGILVGSTLGEENPVVKCINELSRITHEGSLPLRIFYSIEVAWAHYEENA